MRDGTSDAGSKLLTPSDSPGGLRDLPGLFSATEPQNGSFVWGVDPSSVRVSIAGTNGAGTAVTTKSFTKADAKTGQRHAIVYAETFEFARELAAGWPPVRVYLEQPMAYGHQVEPMLFMAVGCIRAALWQALQVPVEMIMPNTWRMHALGRGNAKKHETLPWARRTVGYDGSLEDEGDACAISVAGYRIVHPPQQSLPLPV